MVAPENQPQETLIYLDTETGGLAPEHSTLQIGMAFDDESITRTFRSYVGGNRLVIDPDAMAYNQIDLREAAAWPRPDHVANNISEWLFDLMQWPVVPRTFIACGFNVRFDMDRVNALFAARFPTTPPLFSHRVLDLSSVARFHGMPCKSQELIEWAGYPTAADLKILDRWPGIGPHDALYDALAARAVHRALIDNLRGGEITAAPP